MQEQRRKHYQTDNSDGGDSPLKLKHAQEKPPQTKKREPTRAQELKAISIKQDAQPTTSLHLKTQKQAWKQTKKLNWTYEAAQWQDGTNQQHQQQSNN